MALVAVPKHVATYTDTVTTLLSHCAWCFCRWICRKDTNEFIVLLLFVVYSEFKFSQYFFKRSKLQLAQKSNRQISKVALQMSCVIFARYHFPTSGKLAWRGPTLNSFWQIYCNWISSATNRSLSNSLNN